MADDIDLASDLTEAFNSAAIEANRRQIVKMVPNGVCRNCEAPLANPEALFCDPKCEEEWRWYSKRSNIQRYEGAV